MPAQRRRAASRLRAGDRSRSADDRRGPERRAGAGNGDRGRLPRPLDKYRSLTTNKKTQRGSEDPRRVVPSHSRSSSSLRSYPTSFPIRSLPRDRRLDLHGRNAGPQNARKGSACIERRRTCSIRVNEPDLVDPTIRPPEKPSNRELVISARSPASNML